MKTKVWVSALASAAVIAFLAIAYNVDTSSPLESLADEAWTCKLGGRTVHLRAEDSRSYGEQARVLVEWENGDRDWVLKSRLPQYAKIREIDSDAKALFMSETVDSLIIGRTLSEIEDRYGYALQIKKGKATFPFRILTRGEATSTESATVTFRDSVATAISYEKVEDGKAMRYSWLPLCYWFIDKGIGTAAMQKESFSSNLSDDGKSSPKSSGFIGRLLMGLLGIVLSLAVLVIVGLVPAIVILPLLFLLQSAFSDGFYAKLTGSILLVAVTYVYILLSFIVNGTALLVPIITLAGTLFAIIRYIAYVENNSGYDGSYTSDTVTTSSGSTVTTSTRVTSSRQASFPWGVSYDEALMHFRNMAYVVQAAGQPSQKAVAYMLTLKNNNYGALSDTDFYSCLQNASPLAKVPLGRDAQDGFVNELIDVLVVGGQPDVNGMAAIAQIAAPYGWNATQIASRVQSMMK